MKDINTIKINFSGGIIPPEELYNILVAASKFRILYVRFGLRQQLFIDVEIEDLKDFTAELTMLGITFELNTDHHPNIVSSYPAEDIFILRTWLTGSIYKKIFAEIDYQPQLKINISDCNQSFTPLLTGNINWVASTAEENYWHLFIRFPKTNIVYEWKDLIHSSSIASMSKKIEKIILEQRNRFYDNSEAKGEELFALVSEGNFVTKPSLEPVQLPQFKLPYYEGMNRYANKCWLGIYRRDELFSIKFLKEVCLLCIQTKIAEICSTPWKTIIIKGIEEVNRNDWYNLLDRFQINVRHAQNELNFQVDDNSIEALKLKQHIIKHLNDIDTRTFGVCIGIKTKRKSEVFSSILVRKRPLLRLGKVGLFNVYDILCAKDYNPNERTAFAYSTGNPKFLLAEQVRRAVLDFYRYEGETDAAKADIENEDRVTEAEL